MLWSYSKVNLFCVTAEDYWAYLGMKPVGLLSYIGWMFLGCPGTSSALKMHVDRWNIVPEMTSFCWACRILVAQDYTIQTDGSFEVWWGTPLTRSSFPGRKLFGMGERESLCGISQSSELISDLLSEGVLPCRAKKDSKRKVALVRKKRGFFATILFSHYFYFSPCLPCEVLVKSLRSCQVFSKKMVQF